MPALCPPSPVLRGGPPTVSQAPPYSESLRCGVKGELVGSTEGRLCPLLLPSYNNLCLPGLTSLPVQPCRRPGAPKVCLWLGPSW